MQYIVGAGNDEYRFVREGFGGAYIQLRSVDVEAFEDEMAVHGDECDDIVVDGAPREPHAVRIPMDGVRVGKHSSVFGYRLVMTVASHSDGVVVLADDFRNQLDVSGRPRRDGGQCCDSVSVGLDEPETEGTCRGVDKKIDLVLDRVNQHSQFPTHFLPAVQRSSGLSRGSASQPVGYEYSVTGSRECLCPSIATQGVGKVVFYQVSSNSTGRSGLRA